MESSLMEPPVYYSVNIDSSNRESILRDLNRQRPRAFMVSEDGDIYIGDTEFHKDMAGKHGKFAVLEKGTIHPKSGKINFIHSSAFHSSVTKSAEEQEIQQKIKDEINSFLGTNFH